MGLLTLWKNYLPWTQAVVVAPLIARARSPWLKALWYVVLVSTTVVFVVQSVYLVMDYLSYQKTTNIRLTYEPEAPFPAVTFCNLNPFKKSMVQHSQELTNLLAAYTYVNKLKQAQMKNGTTAAARTTMDNSTESHARRKRQNPATTCQTTQEYHHMPSQDYYCIRKCPNETAFMEFGACNADDPPRTIRLPVSDIDRWRGDMAFIFYECFHQSNYNDGCIYQDGLSALTEERVCLQSHPALAGIVAHALADHCDYHDANCSLGMNEKPAAIYGGYYFHRECGDVITTAFEDCAIPRNIIYNTHSYNNVICDKDQYVDYMSSLVSEAMDSSNCGDACSPGPCAYNDTDTCKGLNYNNFLCTFWRSCDVSTTSSSTRAVTTTLITTVEPFTTESPSSSTTLEMTLTTSASALETTTAPQTAITELSTTTTDALTTTNVAESSELVTTTTTIEPVTATSVPWTSTTATTAMATAITTDDTTGSTTTTSESASTNTDVPVESTLDSTPETTTTRTPLATVSTSTKKFIAPQATISPKPSSTEKTATATKKAASASTTTLSATSTTKPRTTMSAAQATRTPLNELPTANATITKAQTTTTRTRLPSTSASATVSPTHATPTTLKTTRTEGETSTLAKSTTSTQESRTTTTTSAGINLSTTRGPSTMPSSAASPTRKTSLPTTLATPTSSTSSKTTTIHSAGPTGHSSPYANEGSTTSSDRTIAGSTRVVQASTVASSAVRPTEGSITSASSKVAAPSTPPQRPTPTSKHSSSTPNRSSMQATESPTESSSNSDKLVTKSVAETSIFGSEVTTAFGTTGSARATEAAVTDSKLASDSSKPTQSTLSTAMRGPSIATTEKATTSTGDRSTRRSKAPPAITLTPAGGTGSPYSSTNRIDQGTSAAITEDGTPGSKVSGSARSTLTSSATKVTATSAKHGFTAATRSLSPLNGQYTRSTKGAEEHGSHQSTAPNPIMKSTTKNGEQGPGSTTTKGVESSPSTGDVAVGQDRRSTASVTSSALKGSTMSRPMSTPAAENDTSRSPSRKAIASTPPTGHVSGEKNPPTPPPASSSSSKDSTEMTNLPPTSPKKDDSTTAQNKANNPTPTKETGSKADNSPSLTLPTGIANGASQSKESRSSSPLPTEPMTGRGQSGTTMPTMTEKGQGEQTSTTLSGNNRQPTTRSFDNAGMHATTDSDDSVSDGDSKDGSSTTTATTGPPDGSVDRTTKKSTEEGDGLNPNYTTKNPSASTNELTTTSNEDNLKNIKLDVSADFDLDDLAEDQKKNLEDLSNAYGLDPANSQVVVDAYMKQALQTIAAKMSPEERQTLGFRLKDLVSSCIMDGEPCDMINDFEQTFDVDYGNCYTFNYDVLVKYTTRRAGSSHGLRMIIISNSTESLPSASEEGVKIVVHSQDIAPFPNVEGYRSPVGQLVSLQLTQSKLSKLGAPHGNCSTLESITKSKQPFYYNGSYSTEGCLRSCFQRNIAAACGCADSRFPSPTDVNVPFCDPLDTAKYKCKEAYIQDNGDYFFVDNCQCYDACEDTAYRSQIAESDWPAGDFFYGPYCPLADKLNLSCSEFYSNNGMTLEVSFAQLGYEMKEEEPATTAWALINNLAGNSGLWVGYTMLSFTECILLTIQICLWFCRCAKELPEVPSCRRRNFFADVSDDSDSSDSSDDDDAPTTSNSGSAGVCRKRRSAIDRSRMAPKNFDNVIGEKGLTRREVKAVMPTKQELYDPKHAYETVDPITS